MNTYDKFKINGLLSVLLVLCFSSFVSAQEDLFSSIREESKETGTTLPGPQLFSVHFWQCRAKPPPPSAYPANSLRGSRSKLNLEPYGTKSWQAWPSLGWEGSALARAGHPGFWWTRTQGSCVRLPPAFFPPEKPQPPNFGHAGLAKFQNMLVTCWSENDQYVPGPHFSW